MQTTWQDSCRNECTGVSRANINGLADDAGLGFTPKAAGDFVAGRLDDEFQTVTLENCGQDFGPMSLTVRTDVKA